MFLNYYKIVGLSFYQAIQILQNDLKAWVPRDEEYLTEKQIKDLINFNWKKQAHINHPDKGGDIQLMKYTNEAKEALILKEKRVKYNLLFVKYLLKQIDIKFPITHTIGQKKYHILNPEITGDGSVTNMFRTGVVKKQLFDRTIISL